MPLAAWGDPIPAEISGPSFRRKINQRAMRWTVAAIGFVTAGYFFLQN